MADYPTALSAALRARFPMAGLIKSPISSARGLAARMRQLEKAYGSKKAAAAAVGVNPTTYSRWGSGKAHPSKGSAARIDTELSGLARGRSIHKRGPLKGASITATVKNLDARPATPGKAPSSLQYNKGKKDEVPGRRKFNAYDVNAAQLATVVAVWAGGASPATVAAALDQEITHAYGTSFAFEGDNVIVDLR